MSLWNILAKSLKKVRDNDSGIALASKDLEAIPIFSWGVVYPRGHIDCSVLHPYATLLIEQKILLHIYRNKTIAKVQLRIALFSSRDNILLSFIINILNPRI